MKAPFKECDDRGERNRLEIANMKDPDGRPLVQQTKMTVKVDSAEHKELLEQLKASEERFKHLSEAAFEAIAIHQQGRIIDVNQQYLDMFGYTLDEVKQTDGIEMIAPQFRELVTEKMTTGYESPYEVFGIKKDGTVFPVEIRAKEAILDGQPIRIGAIRDLTQQKHEQQQLEASEERYRRLSEAAFEGIVIHEDGTFKESNQQFADMFGYPLDEIKGLNGIDLFAPESREIARQKIASRDRGPYEITCMRKDGSTFTAEIQARAIQLKGKNHRIAAIRDMTKQKKIERQIIASEKRYRELYENSPIALYRTQISDGKLLECNMALVELFGYDSKEEFQAAGTAADRYVDVNDRTVFLEKLEKDKWIESFQAQYKLKNGELRWVEATAEIFAEQGFIEGAMRDITATKCLTNSEKKVLDQLMRGKSNKEVARELGRSVRTIEDHRSHIMRKLGVDNIVDLTRIALEHGIIPDGQ